MSYTRISGIYKIECAASGKVYIGSAVSIRARWASHRSNLRNNRHSNRHLQNAWNKYGEISFVFSVVELCEITDLIPREQFWIDAFNAANPECGLNNSPTASTTIGFRHSEATKAKLSEIASNRDFTKLRENAQSMKGNPSHNKGKPGRKWTDEERAAASAARKGRAAWNRGIPMQEDVRKRISETLLKDGKRRLIGGEVRAEICSLRAAKLTLHEIARKTGVSVAQAHRISSHIDVGPRRGRRKTQRNTIAA
jgi:group I intron endonuclease